MFLWDKADDKLGEECGVFGISGHEEAAAVTALDCTPCSIVAKKRQVLSAGMENIFTLKGE